MIKTIAGLPIQKVSETPPTFNMLIYGESGIGKTTLAGSTIEVPELNDVLLIDTEAGTLTLRNTPYLNIDKITVTKWSEMESLYVAISKEVATNTFPYKTIIIDSLTELQRISMNAILGIDDLSLLEDPNSDQDVAQYKDWNVNTEHMRRIVRRFRDLPINSIFTALVEYVQVTPKSVKRKPLFMGKKLRDEIPPLFDEVFYLYVADKEGEPHRYLLTGQTTETVAKDRFRTLPMVIEDPTMQTIFSYIKTSTEI